MSEKPRMLVSFSCGAASALAAKIAVSHYTNDFNVEVVYADLLTSEHPDNARFLRDVEAWIGTPIKLLRDERYADIHDLFVKDRYISGARGARCSVVLKRRVLDGYATSDDTRVIGYTAEETERARKFESRHPEIDVEWVLIERGITKADCFAALRVAGIELPAMYKLGYDHNNCIGCVKGGMGYWNRIRIDFPDTFKRMAEVERDVGASVLCRDGVETYLDELPKDAGRWSHDQPDECGLFCDAMDASVQMKISTKGKDHE